MPSVLQVYVSLTANYFLLFILQSYFRQIQTRKRRGGPSLSVSSRGRVVRRPMRQAPSSPLPALATTTTSNTSTRKTRGTSKTASSSKSRLPIRTPRYLLEESADAELKPEQPSDSPPSAGRAATKLDAAVDDGKLYCVCRKPHSPDK